MEFQSAILTGAGASSPLDLPTMKNLIEEGFRASLAEHPKRVYDVAANWAARNANDGTVDFEFLYTMVDELASMEPHDPMTLPFAPHLERERGFVFQESNIIEDVSKTRAAAKELRESLRTEVHRRLSGVDAKQAADLYLPFLDDLYQLSSGNSIVPFFTTNYDQAIERIWQFGHAEEYSRDIDLLTPFDTIEDYFGPQFHPETLDQKTDTNRFLVKLHKLHGSLNWVEQNGRTIEAPQEEYFQRNVVIYPVRKHEGFAEPFRKLFKRFEQALSQVDVLVVIGSSLRDKHLFNLIVENLEARSELRVVIHDPNADEISRKFSDDFTSQVIPAKGCFGEPGSRESVKEAITSAFSSSPNSS